MKFSKDTIPLLKRMPVEQLRQFKQWQKEVASTKNWDLELTYNEYRDSFTPIYKCKTDFGGISEHFGGIDAYKLEGKTVHACSYTCDDNIHTRLEFATKDRAKKAYDVMKGSGFGLSTFERVKRYVKSLKLLDESYQFMKENVK